MKKTALISVWNHNYGSLLQTYALQKFLNSNNYSNEIILYKEKRIGRRLKRFLNYHYSVAKSKIIYRNMYIKLFDKAIYNSIQLRSSKFENFKKRELLFSEEVNAYQDLLSVIKNYEMAVLGSDQILHPANLLMNFFTLGFVPDDIKKIGFAASFGVGAIPSYQSKRTKSYLSRFNYLSVRESAGQTIVKKSINKDVPVVCDPTLLLEQEAWMKLKGEQRIVKEKYIFCYFLGSNPNHRDFASKLRDEIGCKIVALQHLDEYVKIDIGFADIAPYDIDPFDFLNLVCNAEYVLADSFHATIFSIIFEKQFFTFNRYKGNGTTSTNSRISSILNLVDLMERNIDGDEDVEECINMSIDYPKVKSDLSVLINHSKEFLLDALS